jgi:hypothetical protein
VGPPPRFYGTRDILKEFESLTEQVFKIMTAGNPGLSVERDVQLPGPEGPRQIDVLLRASVGPIELTTIVECKDHARPVGHEEVGALHSVMQDVLASKGVLVARNGFTASATQKAKRLGIQLMVADRLSNLRETAFDVPVHIHELRQVGLKVDVTMQFAEATRVMPDAIWHVNDLDVLRLMRDEMLNDPWLARRIAGRHRWEAKDLRPPYFIRDVYGRRWEFDDISFSYAVEERHFFGYLSQVDGVLHLRDEIEKKSSFFLPAELVDFDYLSRFTQFGRVEDLPVKPKVSFPAVVLQEPTGLTFGASISPTPVPADPAE